MLPGISRLADGFCRCLLKDGITRCRNPIATPDKYVHETRNAARIGLCMVHWRGYHELFPMAPEWWLWPETLKTRLIDLVRRSGVDDAEILIQNLEKRIR